LELGTVIGVRAWVAVPELPELGPVLRTPTFGLLPAGAGSTSVRDRLADPPQCH